VARVSVLRETFGECVREVVMGRAVNETHGAGGDVVLDVVRFNVNVLVAVGSRLHRCYDEDVVQCQCSSFECLHSFPSHCPPSPRGRVLRWKCGGINTLATLKNVKKVDSGSVARNVVENGLKRKIAENGLKRKIAEHVRTHRLVKDNELECLRSGIDIRMRGQIERTRPCQVLPLQPACH